jgi:hypothetical protein
VIETQKKIYALTGAAVTAVLLTVMFIQIPAIPLFFRGNVGVSFTMGSIHATITMERNGEKIFEQYHAGAVTTLGTNFTLGKLTGNATYYNMTAFPMNLSYVSIGDQGTLSTASDVLPGEWNRTGELADYIIVPRVNGKAAGFLTLKQHADKVGDTTVGLLVLVAVDPSMRGKSIYTNMISLGLRFLKREAEIVETGTQVTNYAVQKAWVQLGLKQVTTTYVFHKWLTS